MGRRTLLVIASVLVAAAGTALIWVYVQGADARARRDWQDLVTVLVATESIDVGSDAEAVADRTEPRRVPRQLLPDRPVAADSWVGTRRTTVPVLAGQYVVEAQFEKANAISGVPDGRMALSLSMEDPNRVASLLKPESRVAVFAVTSSKSARTVAAVLPDVRVIGVGSTTSALNPKGDPARVGTQSGVSTALVTLDVDTGEALRLMAYQSAASLYFTLLGKDAKVDTKQTFTLPVDASEADAG